MASAGAILPLSFRDRNALRVLQHKVAVAPYLYEEEDIVYNEEVLNQRFANNQKGRVSYVVSFREMARKGFVSMDRTLLTIPNDNLYTIVCWPRMWDKQRMEYFEVPLMPIGEMPLLNFRPFGLLEYKKRTN